MEHAYSRTRCRVEDAYSTCRALAHGSSVCDPESVFRADSEHEACHCVKKAPCCRSGRSGRSARGGCGGHYLMQRELPSLTQIEVVAVEQSAARCRSRRAIFNAPTTWPISARSVRCRCWSPTARRSPTILATIAAWWRVADSDPVNPGAGRAGGASSPADSLARSGRSGHAQLTQSPCPRDHVQLIRRLGHDGTVKCTGRAR